MRGCENLHEARRLWMAGRRRTSRLTLEADIGIMLPTLADVAQRQSKGLISLWPVVRFHPSAPGEPHEKRRQRQSKRGQAGPLVRLRDSKLPGRPRPGWSNVFFSGRARPGSDGAGRDRGRVFRGTRLASARRGVALGAMRSLGIDVVLVHVDHRLRGSSAEEATRAAILAESLNLEMSGRCGRDVADRRASPGSGWRRRRAGSATAAYSR